MAWWKRYEPLLEAKPRAGLDVVIDLLAQELCDMCLAFPPQAQEVDFEDQALARRLRGRLHRLPPVDAAFAQALFKILRWDLDNEHAAIDHFLRNGHHRTACPSEDHVDALHFLWRGAIEHLLARQEECRGLVKRRHLVDVVDRTEPRLTRCLSGLAAS